MKYLIFLVGKKTSELAVFVIISARAEKLILAVFGR